MTEIDRLQQIQQRLASNEYFVHPLSDANVREDITYLMNLLAEKNKQIEDLQKKNKVLSDHAMELAQEIENVKSDFGGSNSR